MAYRITNPKGETRTGLTAKDVSNFKASLKERGIENPGAAGYVLEEESNTETVKNDGRTSYQERKDYFGGGAAGALAEAFPSLAEQYMKGNMEYDLGTLKAGVSDMLTLPGRALDSFNDAAFSDKGFDLGRRSGEETGIVSSFARDPMTLPTIAGAGLLGKGVQAGANLGKATNIAGGRLIGAGVAGAAEGAGLEAASAKMNDREITGLNLGIGAVLGGGFEALGTVAQQLLQRFGKDYVKAAAQSARLGNTDRAMTDEELVQFLSDPRNAETMKTILDKGSEGLNMTPFVGDRGKRLQPEVNAARKEAVGTISNEPALNSGFGGKIDETLSPTEADMKRRIDALNTPETALEDYLPKTTYKEGRRNALDMAYGPDTDGGILYAQPRRADSKLKTYESNAQYNLEKFADKYENITSQLERGKVYSGELTRDEMQLLDEINREMANDHAIIAGYSPEKVISSNKFLGDRVPFNNSFYDSVVGPFIDAHPNGVSSEFVQELRHIVGEGDNFTRGVSDNIRKAFNGKEAAALERAFAYADTTPIKVSRGYRDAIDRFSDTLSDYADLRTGKPGINAKGEEYVVGQEKMKKYSYSYLAKVQEALAKRGALSADEIVTLYGLATNVNDKVVQDAIIQLLRDLNVSKSAIAKFEQVGGKYAMLNKSRTRMKKNANEDNPFKGTMAAPIVPQEGFNTKNALGYRLQGENIDLGNLSTTNNPTAVGTIVRRAYDLGIPYFVDFRKKSE